MTDKDFRKRLKVKQEDLKKEEKTNVEKSFEMQAKLKRNPEYKKRFDEVFLSIINLFCDRYKGVGIDCPIARTKSDKSLKEKIQNNEIKRLCTIGAIDKLKDEEKAELEKLILEYGKIDKDVMQKKVKKVLNDKIEDLKVVDSLMKEEDINDNVKMAILRIARIRLEKEENDIEKRERFINLLEYSYGEEAAKRTGKLANNKMHWENIESIRSAKSRINTKDEEPDDRDTLRKLYDPEKYLKVKDLKGFRIVICSIPDELETDNDFIKGIIERRKKAPQPEVVRYNDWCCIEVEKDFASYLENNPEVLKKMNIKLVARKEKSKQNGYLADHLKFVDIDNEDFGCEMQIRTLYRDDLARGNGPAGHNKRAGKKKEISGTSNREAFLKKARYETPEYETAPKDENGKYYIKECTAQENFIAFHTEADYGSKEFGKALEYLAEDSMVK